MNKQYHTLAIIDSHNNSTGKTQNFYALMAMLVLTFIIAFALNSQVQAAGKKKDSPPPIIEQDPTAVKWHPGHYFTIQSRNKDSVNYMAQVYSDLENTPALRGIQLRYDWSELETDKGVYDFTAIDQVLAELASRGKRLVILLQTKSFTQDTLLVPDYLKTDPLYEGGVFATDSPYTGFQGYNIKFWNAEVRKRMVALVRALGAKYNTHPYFEGIGMIETAMGQAVEPLTSAQVDGFFSNLLIINQRFRDFFPNTMTYQFANYPRPMLETFVPSLGEMGAALGGPDTFPDEPGLNFSGSPKGVYNYYPDLSGIVPLAPSVMPKNYRNTRGDGSGYEPTVDELFAFARDNLKANYVFWTRDKDYYQLVLEMLNMGTLASDSFGGLHNTCPSKYSSCVTQ